MKIPHLSKEKLVNSYITLAEKAEQLVGKQGLFKKLPALFLHSMTCNRISHIAVSTEIITTTNLNYLCK